MKSSIRLLSSLGSSLSHRWPPFGGRVRKGNLRGVFVRSFVDVGFRFAVLEGVVPRRFFGIVRLFVWT